MKSEKFHVDLCACNSAKRGNVKLFTWTFPPSNLLAESEKVENLMTLEHNIITTALRARNVSSF